MKVFILLVLLNLHLVWNQEHTRTILKFGEDGGSYIYMGDVDLTAMEDTFTICSWVRRMSRWRRSQVWVSYVGDTRKTGEIRIDVTARSFLLGSYTSFTKPTQVVGDWNHMCHTFNHATRTKQVFYNGELIFLGSANYGRFLDRRGTLMFGNDHYGGNDPSVNNYFGGELYDTNFFSTELSADQIKQLYNEGRCSNYSKMFTDNTVLSWEDILSHQRTGYVTEVQFECENEDDSVWDFLRSEEFYNHLITEEMASRWELLGEFLGYRIDDTLIEHLVKHHSYTA